MNPTIMHSTARALPARRLRLALLAAVAAAAACALPAAASAATVELASDGTLKYRAAAGEVNSVAVRKDGTGVLVSDGLAALSAKGTQCTAFGGRQVRCEGFPINIRFADVQLGDRNDFAGINVSFPVVVDGGVGDDTYDGGGGGDGISRVDFRGGTGFDLASYANATRGVKASNDGTPGDGRIAFDNDTIRGDVERLAGSRFADELAAGSGKPELCCAAQTLSGGAGDDVLRAGGFATTFLMGRTADGADRILPGTTVSRVDYGERTRPVTVTQDNGSADDGEAGERDEIVGLSHTVLGGSADDVLRARPGSFAPHRLFGQGGNDTLEGAEGPDDLTGGPGQDTLLAKGGADLVRANDGFPDVVACGSGPEIDFAELDSRDGFTGCERRTVGALRLAPRALRIRAGEAARLQLSWRHPRSWRDLRRVELRLYSGDVRVGSVAISPRRGRLSDAGAVTVLARASRLTRRGRSVDARLVLRLDRSLAGRRLRAQVEAVDVSGSRQVERKAGSIRVR